MPLPDHVSFTPSIPFLSLPVRPVPPTQPQTILGNSSLQEPRPSRLCLPPAQAPPLFLHSSTNTNLYILPWPCHQHDHRCPNRPIQGAPWSPWGTRSVALVTADGSGHPLGTLPYPCLKQPSPPTNPTPDRGLSQPDPDTQLPTHRWLLRVPETRLTQPIHDRPTAPAPRYGGHRH